MIVGNYNPENPPSVALAAGSQALNRSSWTACAHRVRPSLFYCSFYSGDPGRLRKSGLACRRIVWRGFLGLCGFDASRT
jgi:hypothetical protein